MHLILLPLLLAGCRNYPDGPLDSGPARDTGVRARPATAPASACGLEVGLPGDEFVEGDIIAFQVRCRDGDRSAVDLSVQGADPAAHFDARTGAFSWQTDGADAASVELLISASSPGSTALPETVRVSFHINDDATRADAVPPDPATYPVELGLPVVHLLFDEELAPYDRPASFHILGQHLEGEAKIRGASSRAYPKNSYTLDFDGGDLDVPAWGVERDHLVLTSTFDDNSYVRQKLSYDVWAALGAEADPPRLTPRTFFCVVYLNAEYHGLYVASDRVDEEFVEQMGRDGAGELFKSVSHAANWGDRDSDGVAKSDLAEGWEKKEGFGLAVADLDDDDDDDDDDGGSTDLDAELGTIRSLTGRVAAAGPADWAAIADAALDRQAFMDWHLLVIAGFTEDTVGKNAYVHVDPETGRATVMPWDFNASWGQSWRTYRRDPGQLRDHTGDNRIFWMHERDPASWAALRARYGALRQGGPLDPAWQRARLDAYYALIDRAAQKDWDRWEGEYRSFDRWKVKRDSKQDWTDFEGEKAYLYDWIDQRAAHMPGWVGAL